MVVLSGSAATVVAPPSVVDPLDEALGQSLPNTVYSLGGQRPAQMAQVVASFCVAPGPSGRPGRRLSPVVVPEADESSLPTRRPVIARFCGKAFESARSERGLNEARSLYSQMLYARNLTGD